MKTIKESVEVKADAEYVFDLTQNYQERLKWDPYLVEAYLMNGASEAKKGVLSYCKNKNGSGMVSEYISFNRPSVAAVSMIKGPFMLKKFSGAWNVKAADSFGSTLIFTYNFELKGGFLGKLILPIATYLFSKDMKKRLLCFKEYAEQAYK